MQPGTDYQLVRRELPELKGLLTLATSCVFTYFPVQHQDAILKVEVYLWQFAQLHAKNKMHVAVAL